MYIHTTSELSYKNGYARGFQDAQKRAGEPQGWTSVKYSPLKPDPLQPSTTIYQHIECPVNPHAGSKTVTPFCPHCGAPMTARMKHLNYADIIARHSKGQEETNA